MVAATRGCEGEHMATVTATHRILLVDDHPAVTTGVERLFAEEPDLDVVAVATQTGAARRLAEALQPAVVIVDMHLPGANGVLLAHDLLAERAARAAVIYTAFSDDLVGLAALIAGANATVSKGALGSDLVDAVRAAADGRVDIPTVSSATHIEVAHRLEACDLPILGMMRHGTPQAQIATVLGVGEGELAERRRAMVRSLLDGLA
jgi:DNA-binding NarL/FixJ family response regulator